jgi:Protein tyrosine and serine/threonine kinase
LQAGHFFPHTLAFRAKNAVWSLGVLIWELYSVAKNPYGGLMNEDVEQGILAGTLRLEQPEACPSDVFDVCMWCWTSDFSERPSAEQVRSALQSLFESRSMPDSMLRVMTLNTMVAGVTPITDYSRAQTPTGYFTPAGDYVSVEHLIASSNLSVETAETPEMSDDFYQTGGEREDFYNVR